MARLSPLATSYLLERQVQLPFLVSRQNKKATPPPSRRTQAKNDSPIRLACLFRDWLLPILPIPPYQPMVTSPPSSTAGKGAECLPHSASLQLTPWDAGCVRQYPRNNQVLNSACNGFEGTGKLSSLVDLLSPQTALPSGGAFY